MLEGNPGGLAIRAQEYLATAALIAQAADQMRAFVVSGSAASLRVLQNHGAAAAGGLDRVLERYRGTALALQEYAGELARGHDRADEAARQEESLLVALRDAQESSVRLQSWLGQAELLGIPAGLMTSAVGRLSETRQDAFALEQLVEDARAEQAAAQSEVNAAASVAMASISAAILDTNESFGDHITYSIAEFLGTEGIFERWVGDVFGWLNLTTMRVAATVSAALGSALIMLAGSALVTGFPVMGPTLSVLVPALLSGLLLGGVLSDVLRPTPTVRLLAPPSRLGVSHSAQSSATELGLAMVLEETTVVDQLGADWEGGVAAATVVSIAKVVDVSGVVRWRVALPSTQEWLTRWGTDEGAVNDMDGNLALMLTPVLRSQYERAVLEAMFQAGIEPSDQVMLVGFSQGGIMAGHLAAYSDAFNWSSIIVAGAPIDHMPIPPEVTVVSVQHRGDPVPALDTVVTVGVGGYAPQRPNWTTITADSPDQSQGLGGIHNSRHYSTTLMQQIGQVSQSELSELGRYFADGPDVYGVQQRYYSWAE